MALRKGCIFFGIDMSLFWYRGFLSLLRFGIEIFSGIEILHSSVQHLEVGKQKIGKETHKQKFHGIVPGLSRDCPGIFLRFPRSFVYVFPFFPKEKKATYKQI